MPCPADPLAPARLTAPRCSSSGDGGPGRQRRRWLAGLLALPLGGLARAEPGLAAPKGTVVLSISGQISRSNAPQRADFDLAMLEALPMHSFSTQTPWFAGAREFSGPLLRDVLAAAGSRGSTLYAVALNNYKIELPVEDTRRFKVLLATRLDGKPMSVREKGPLFVIYPFDESSELRSERYYSRSIWQLRSLQVR